MARPSSRGGMGMPQGNRRGPGPVAAPHFGGATGAQFGRPATPSQYASQNPFNNIRPPTASNRGPPTMAGSIRPGSGMKRLGTGAMGPMGPQGPGLNTSVQVDHRPVTQQGLTGMHTKPLGPSRQIADKSYYLTELRTKVTEIMGEIDSMKNEITQTDTDNKTYTQLERKYETVIQEVRQLEGELADFNLALDKVRTNTSIAEIKEMHERLKQRNDRERQTVDEIFLKASEKDQQTQECEERIHEIHSQAAQRLAALGEDLQDEYSELQEMNANIGQQINRKEQHILELDNKLNNMQSESKSREWQIRLRGVQLTKKRTELLKRREELEEETNEHLSPDQMREKLLQKVKDQNAQIADVEARTKRMEDTVENLQDDIREKEQELSEAKRHAQKAKKYEAVYERDRKMQEFIDRYPESKLEEQQNKTKLQSTIVALLKHISKGIKTSTNLPNPERLTDMKQELTFKQEQMQNSETTMAMLKGDLSKREEELDKIKSLDKKITVELQSLGERKQKMLEELENFKNIDQVRTDAEESKKHLQVSTQQAKKQRENYKQQVQLLSRQFDKLKKELSSSDTTRRLDQAEQKLRTYSQNVYTLQDFINTRKRESDYDSLRDKVQQLCEQINSLTVQNVNNSKLGIM